MARSYLVSAKKLRRHQDKQYAIQMSNLLCMKLVVYLKTQLTRARN
jgi:hypothetical protein